MCVRVARENQFLSISNEAKAAFCPEDTLGFLINFSYDLFIGSVIQSELFRVQPFECLQLIVQHPVRVFR